MPAAILGDVLDVQRCAAMLAGTPWNGVAVYVLWNIDTMEPVYCGTAESKGRLQSHLKKNDPTRAPSSHNLKNPQLTKYWQSQRHGWLGVSFRMYDTSVEAKAVERRIISHYGLRSANGVLFNQRLAG